MIDGARKFGSPVIRETLRQSQKEFDAIKPAGAPATMEECIPPWFLDNFGVARGIPAAINNPQTRSAIVAMQWWYRDFDECIINLLTCDRPLIGHKGIAADDFFLALPLSPKVGFFVTRNPRTMKKLCDLTLRKLAIFFNESMVFNAVDHVYALNDCVRKFIEQRLRRSPKSQP